jgi:hypothetical protein
VRREWKVKRPIWTWKHWLAYQRGLRMGMTADHALMYVWECFAERKYPFNEVRGPESR